MEEYAAWIPLADGKRLAARLWLPADRAGGRHPRGAAVPHGRSHLVVRGRVRADRRAKAGSRCAASTSAAPARRRGSPSTSTTRRSSETSSTRSLARRRRSGATATSGCTAPRTRASTACRLACERPAALKAICAIYRERRSLPRRRALLRRRLQGDRRDRLRPLHGLARRAATGARARRPTMASNAGPSGSRGRTPGFCVGSRSSRTGRTGGSGSVRSAIRAGRDLGGLRPDRLPDDARRAAGPTATATTPSARSRTSSARSGCCSGPGRTCRPRPRSPGRTSTSSPS